MSKTNANKKDPQKKYRLGTASNKISLIADFKTQVDKIILQAILKALGPLNGSSCWIPLGFVFFDCLFQRRDDARG